MARKNILEQIDKVAKNAEVKGALIEFKNIADKDLIDYPDNQEDVSFTEDLEISMEQNGFTDPIEVTGYRMETGKYMILSGHRRRMAARKKGYTFLPCIIRNFDNDKDFKNYILMSNSYRNAITDPLLYCKRYKMHESFLKENHFSGSIKEEIAKRLGLSVKQAERYNKMNNVILPVWDLIRDEKVGMSSVTFLAEYSKEEQHMFYKRMLDVIDAGGTLTRGMCEAIRKEYKKPSGESATAPDEKPSEKPVVAPDEKPLGKPATAPDEKPSEKPVVAPDEKPSGAAFQKQEIFLYHLSKVDEHLIDSDSFKCFESKEAAQGVINKMFAVILDILVETEKIEEQFNLKKYCHLKYNEVEKALEKINEK